MAHFDRPLKMSLIIWTLLVRVQVDYLYRLMTGNSHLLSQASLIVHAKSAFFLLCSEMKLLNADTLSVTDVKVCHRAFLN